MLKGGTSIHTDSNQGAKLRMSMNFLRKMTFVGINYKLQL